MREIKFRGLFRNEDWIYGRMCQDKILDKEVWYMQTGDIMNDNEYQEYEVDLNTIGQYTGLKDKNGKEIFDKDIIVIKKSKYVVDKGIDCKIYDFRCFNDKYDDEIYDSNYFNDDYLSDFNSINIEIIGNIHQNPELL